ncbi:MAG: carbohydrate kinase family protein [Candidatus Bathyarchaeota archaeon]|jgi:ribokinase|nr:carbohydrate kinase family protein [Candidatus Bathyarchaeota archaeon A05DMB-5]MDH7557500.1 carbohydrate kinase family protein [Candidatus Bathyarchaeota archaeon]
MTRFDVVGFGALNVDKLFRVNKIAGAEEEGFIIDCEEACGGSAANTIVGLARLKCKVGFIGKVASDREGEMLVEDFRREGVDTSGIVHVNDGRSGVVMGFVDEKGERALYVDPGVNDAIGFEEIDKKYAFQTKFLHLTSFVGEKSFQAQRKLVEALPKTVKVSLDPGELYARKGIAKLEPMISKAFVLMPNQAELKLLTKMNDYEKGTELLLEKGVRVVAVKLGSKGCYVTDGKEKHLIKPFKVQVIDTTGAGDAFCAGFLYGLLRNKSLYECGKLGNFVASRCIMKIGARPGLPSLEDLEQNKLA